MAGVEHRKEWSKLQKLVTIESPTSVSRLLGVYHHMDTIEGVPTVRIQKDFLESAVKRYESIANAPPLKSKMQHPWRHPDGSGLSHLTEGKLKKEAPGLLMKLLYAARMCRPDLAWTS
eukprot:3763813-Amphidinium_carterae.1